jgi:hypothetical protein
LINSTDNQGLLGQTGQGSIEALQPNFATSGGSSGGASGRTMQECMAAWDKGTHVAKPRWREICARTLTYPHI